jgi:lysophospholipase L1-like esterase
MYDIHIPTIDENSKLIIGLGDSFTQGVGSWSKNTYKKYGGFIDPLKVPKSLEFEMYDYSWVSQICKNHLPNFTPVNFGASGKGNRASVKELYLNPKVKMEKANEATLVLMLSGIERFDFINREFEEHHHFFAMWPNPWDKNATQKQLWEAYARDIWSEKFVCLEALLNIREAAIFAKAQGWNFIVASAFDQRITRENFIDKIGEEHTALIDTVPWDKFIRPQGCKSFMQLLLRYDGREDLADGAFYDYYSKLKEPTEYITTCMHPTREGYRIMAEEIFKFMKEKGYVKE